MRDSRGLSFIYIQLYVEKNVIENTKVERGMPRYMLGTVISEIVGVYFLFMIGFGMRILYSEPKPEAKEFLKSLYGICFLILGIMIIQYAGVRTVDNFIL